MKKMPNGQDLLEEYDFSEGNKGKYAKRYAQGTNVVVIDPEVAEFFPDNDAVNQALRSLGEIIKKTQGGCLTNNSSGRGLLTPASYGCHWPGRQELLSG